MDAVDFRGKKVLDLGCNLGEISRSARSRGASLVDGFEYDKLFIEIGNMVNAYNGTTRVSFYQRDITSPSIYTEKYDIVLAFSVFTYIRDVIPKIAEITNGIFILETHQLKNNLESVYLKEISPFFKFHKIIAKTDWGTNKDASEIRMVIAFSDDENMLESIIKKNLVPELGTTGVLDLQRSHFKFLENFFSKYNQGDGLSQGGIQKIVSGPKLNASKYRSSRDYHPGLSGCLYWIFYLRGFFNYLERGSVDLKNEYIIFLKNYYFDTKFDPEFGKIVPDESKLLSRIARRFETTKSIYKGLDDIYQITLFDVVEENERNTLFIVGSNEPFSCGNIDGYHRLFSAYLFDKKQIPFVIRKTENDNK